MRAATQTRLSHRKATLVARFLSTSASLEPQGAAACRGWFTPPAAHPPALESGGMRRQASRLSYATGACSQFKYIYQLCKEHRAEPREHGGGVPQKDTPTPRTIRGERIPTDARDVFPLPRTAPSSSMH